MRFKKADVATAQPDMTPMIDVVFQLIAFFMVVVNFSAVSADERIKLPISSLARPPLSPPEDPLVLNMDHRGVLFYSGLEISMEEFTPYLKNERRIADYRRRAKNSSKLATTVIIRASQETPTGKVQELVQMCRNCRDSWSGPLAACQMNH